MSLKKYHPSLQRATEIFRRAEKHKEQSEDGRREASWLIGDFVELIKELERTEIKLMRVDIDLTAANLRIASLNSANVTLQSNSDAQTQQITKLQAQVAALQSAGTLDTGDTTALSSFEADPNNASFIAQATSQLNPLPATPAVPAAPTLTATPNAASGIDFTVGPVASGVTFNIFSGTTAGGESTTPINSAPIDGSATFNAKFTVGVPLFFTAVAINSAGPSPASAEVSATATA